MNTQPEALLYNFNDPERLRQIRRYLNRQKVKTRIVTAPEFLHFFRENQIPPVALKAMLTPVTQHWSSIQLHDELLKEHTLMHKK